MGLKQTVGRQFAPRLQELAPGLTSGFVREALNRAVDGVGPLTPVAKAADKQLAGLKPGAGYRRSVGGLSGSSRLLAPGFRPHGTSAWSLFVSSGCPAMRTVPNVACRV